jgi:hypothetical protein
MKLTLKRIASRQDGTFGVLLADGRPFAVTLERPWRDNKRGESCIPAGAYTCIRVHSPRFGTTWMVRDVPNRSEILFHAGNIFHDSHGCILVAEKFATWADGSTSIADSRIGMAELLDLSRDFASLDLLIEDCHETH